MIVDRAGAPTRVATQIVSGKSTDLSVLRTSLSPGPPDADRGFFPYRLWHSVRMRVRLRRGGLG
jgi:hypothetical protein